MNIAELVALLRAMEDAQQGIEYTYGIEEYFGRGDYHAPDELLDAHFVWRYRLDCLRWKGRYRLTQ